MQYVQFYLKNDGGKKELIRFKSKSDVRKDTVYSLPWVVIHEYPTLFDESEWARCHDNIVERVRPLVVSFWCQPTDGRKKSVKQLEWFSWRKVFDRIKEVKVGDKVRIIKMDDSNGKDSQAKEYAEKEGIVEHIDDLGQLHGTWGGLSLIPNADRYLKIS